MTTVDPPRARPSEPEPPAPGGGGGEEPRATGLLGWLTSTDHKVIGLAYLITAFVFFLFGGALALVVRAELYSPGTQFVSPSTYNQVFTMHGSIMIYLFIVPAAFGFANYFVPLQIGARDMAFPRLNALSYWLYLFGALTMVSGFLTADGPANFGWTAYAPLSNAVRSPSVGNDLWLIAVVITGTSTILGAVNVVATVLAMRAPGMSMFRMPIFTWNMLVTSLLVLIAFPVLTSAAAMMLADRRLGAHIFDPAAGGSPILWQHLFWFFGHPEVYIAALPFFGIITEVLPVFSRRPIFGYTGIVLATFTIAAYSVGVWAHHMFTTGAVETGFFSGMTYVIAVPTGIKFVNWIGTLWGGRMKIEPAMAFALGFLFLFLFGGLTGVILATAPVDFALHDTYFVVAHMHYVMFGGSAFALYAGFYYWFPKMTGRMLGRGLAWWHFWTTFVGFNLTFLVQHVLGLEGMPRRVADYRAADGFTTLNRVSTIGAFLTGVSVLPLIWNVWRSWRHGAPAGDDPWGGQTLEWATTSPPPPHNFDGLPPIRSNRPVWDANHPDHPAEGHGRGEGDGRREPAEVGP
ncbi:MAG: cytochrome c oxidase subunit I [Actinobacteria bacterium]|nr:cytochrome c oxidase subunit I [Actinomycetota bacterium]